jgi:N-formylmaleamate deformylase
MTVLVGGEVIANGVRLHYERSGSGLTPLVLLHGLSDDGRCWAPVVDAFTDAFEVVTVDARGHGLSDAPEDGYRLGTLAEDLAWVLRELRLERPVLLGHSLGALTAMALAGLHPDLPAAILLEDPPPLWLHDGPTPDDVALSRSIAAGIVSVKRLTRDELRREVTAQNPAWPEAEIEPWIEAKKAFNLRAVPLATPEHLAAFDVRSVLGAITCPVTVLHGDPLRGSMSTVADLEVLRTLVPQLEVVHIPGAGHSIRRDQQARYLEAVREALGA